MTIDINELRRLMQDFKLAGSPMLVQTAQMSELLDRLEAAEKSDAESIAMYRKARDERDALRTALEKIADWDSAWGPYPETNKAWCAMAIVTAREAVPQPGETK